MLLEYTKEYYNDGFIIPDTYLSLYSDVCEELDIVKQFVENNFIITHNSIDRLSKNDFTTFFNQANNTKKQFSELLNKLKEINIQYEKNIWSNGCKGCLVGIRQKTDNDIDKDEIDIKRSGRIR